MAAHNPDLIEQLLSLLAAHREALRHALTQRAYFDVGHVPAHLARTIASARAEITQLKAELRRQGVAVDDLSGDEAGPEETKPPSNPPPDGQLYSQVISGNAQVVIGRWRHRLLARSSAHL